MTPLLFWLGVPHTTQLSFIHSVWWGIRLCVLTKSDLIPLPSLHCGEGSSLPGLVPSYDMVNSESVVGIKLCDTSVVIGIRLMILCTSD